MYNVHDCVYTHVQCTCMNVHYTHEVPVNVHLHCTCTKSWCFFPITFGCYLCICCVCHAHACTYRNVMYIHACTCMRVPNLTRIFMLSVTLSLLAPCNPMPPVTHPVAQLGIVIDLKEKKARSSLSSPSLVRGGACNSSC